VRKKIEATIQIRFKEKSEKDLVAMYESKKAYEHGGGKTKGFGKKGFRPCHTVGGRGPERRLTGQNNEGGNETENHLSLASGSNRRRKLEP